MRAWNQSAALLHRSLAVAAVLAFALLLPSVAEGANGMAPGPVAGASGTKIAPQLQPPGAGAKPVNQNVATEQKLASLLGNQRVRSRPSARAKTIAVVRAKRPLTGERTILPVIARSTDKKHHRWLKVRLPGRVLGKSAPPHVGWISDSGADAFLTSWQIVIKLRARHVLVYHAGRLTRTFKAVVGKPSTPTPKGKFFVEENIRMPSSAAGAPFALATNARSSVFQEFEGGPGQIALHGLDNVGGNLGSAESHGCIRLANKDIAWLARRAGLGTPVTIK